MTMREILFRGKRVKPVALVSHWIFGNYVFKADKSLPGLGKHFIVVHDGFGLSQWVEVDADTVGQYTGLMDKDGTRIFDGDIVRWTLQDLYLTGSYAYYTSYGYGSHLVVTALNSGFTLRPIKDNAPETPNANGKIDNYSFWNNQHFLEVVGNIYDNPGLMEG